MSTHRYQAKTGIQVTQFKTTAPSCCPHMCSMQDFWNPIVLFTFTVAPCISMIQSPLVTNKCTKYTYYLILF
jgi:hypothetical protein